MNVLVIGGAGYIGSITARLLHENGFKVVVVDNLPRGHRKAVPPGIHLIEADLADTARLRHVLISEHIDAVMHFAGLIEVGESMAGNSNRQQQAYPDETVFLPRVFREAAGAFSDNTGVLIKR